MSIFPRPQALLGNQGICVYPRSSAVLFFQSVFLSVFHPWLFFPFVALVYYGGLRSGMDAAKLIAMGESAVVFGDPVSFAVGGEISDSGCVTYASNYTAEDCPFPAYELNA